MNVSYAIDSEVTHESMGTAFSADARFNHNMEVEKPVALIDLFVEEEYVFRSSAKLSALYSKNCTEPGTDILTV